MSGKDIKQLVELAKKKLKENRTKEEALAELISAGIMTKKGNFTKPYKNLSKIVNK